MKHCHDDSILILDFGSQTTQLIARRIRELGVFCEILPANCADDSITARAYKGIILSGGPETVTQSESLRAPACVFTLGIPVLGICYGMQTMAHQLGGKVVATETSEFGSAMLTVVNISPLFASETTLTEVWMSHGDHVVTLPPSFICVAKTENTTIAAMQSESGQFYGVQFHPEVTHTKDGSELLKRFVTEVCGCACLWKPEMIIDELMTSIRETVGQQHVLLGLSGGVDSAVVAALMHQAIGDQLICLFVDNGLLRQGEVEEVRETFQNHFNMQLVVVDAQDRFFSALKGVTCPEEKRKKIGHAFIDVFDEFSHAHPEISFLAQGTIYPDVIESAGASSGHAEVIKSHHNVGGLPEHMRLTVIEPLRELFKDEVRKIGLLLGLPEKLIYRHPFPGPGLAVRVLGEVTRTATDIVREVDAIFIQELRNHQLYDTVSQAFAVFLPVKSVGVKGDARRYEYVVALRAVNTIDFMTATWAELPYHFLALVSLRIMNEVNHVTRVTYDISGKPPATIEWE